jgi:hypothetical protein
LQPTWWSRPGNWSPMGVPGFGDDVLIADPTWECVQTVPNNEINNLSVSNNSTLNTGLQGLIVDDDATIGDSTLNGGTLTLNGTATLTGTVSWVGGGLATSGTGTWTNTGTINVGGAGTTYVTLGGTLNNDGIITVTSQTFYFANGVLNNLSDGTFSMQGNGVVVGTTSVPSNFNNSGTVQKSGSGATDVTGFSVSLNNAPDGIVNVQTGILALGGNVYTDTSTGGIFNVSPGAVFDLGGLGTHNWTGTYTGSGGGTVLLGGSGRLAIGSDGATFNLPQGMFQWTGGTIDATAGALTNVQTGYITLGGSGILRGGALNNLGTITQQPSSALSLQQPNAAVNNSGLYEIQVDGVPVTGSDGAFNNLPGGIFQKSAGTGTAVVSSLPFNNSAGATINVTSGTLVLGGSGGGGTDAGGTFNVSTGSVLDLNAGVSNPTLTGTYTGSGGGSVILAFSQWVIGSDGATFNFPQGLFQWIGGVIDTSAGTLTNAATGYMTISGNPVAVLRGGVLVNNGTITQVAGNGFSQTQLMLQNGAVLNNNGLYDIQEDGTNLSANPVGTPQFNNLSGGTFQKSAGTGTTTNGSLPFNNVGTVTVNSGTLLLANVAQDNGSTHTLTDGIWNVFTNSTLRFNSGDSLTVNNATVVLDGAGSTFTNIANLAANSGTFQVLDGAAYTTVGNFSNTGTLTIGLASVFTVNGDYTQGPNATLEIQLGGTPDTGLFGQLAVAGNVALDGTLTLTAVNGYIPSSGDAFQIMTFASRDGSDFANQPTGWDEVFDDVNGNLSVIAQ